jgi:hypothetical protein
MSNRTYDGGYTVGDLDCMGGDEIRAMTTKGLRAMRAEALKDAQRALARLERATSYLTYRQHNPAMKMREDANEQRALTACTLIDEVKP